tara:strand:- start:37904 stop:38071 length:168 start_codon:yes stop_codon:yes gene_type:complete
MKDYDKERVFVGFILWFIIALTVAFALTGCNTMVGLGQDISSAAQGIQKEMSTND